MKPASASSELRIIEPAPGVLGFYAGRGPDAGDALAGDWVQETLALGICAYAVVDGAEAMVFDTHLSPEHGRVIRQHLEAMGVRSIRVALSHWHHDHIAGNEAFADCEIIAGALTAALLRDNRAALEARDPPIRPLVLPTRTFEHRLDLAVGATAVQLHCFDIHSQDGVILLLPDRGLLLAGDTLEAPIPFVSEPQRLSVHLGELDRLQRLGMSRYLPSHGAEERLASGGYGTGLVAANRRYLARLNEGQGGTGAGSTDLAAWIAADLATGVIEPWDAYRAVHRRNLSRVGWGPPSAADAS